MTRHLKRTFAAICITLVSVNAATAAAPGPDNGFRELRWGSKPTNEMVDTAEKKDGMAVHIKKDYPTIRFAGVDNASVKYLYNNDKLCAVDLTWPAVREMTTRTISTKLKKEWGAPDRKQEEAQGMFYGWFSSDRRTEASYRSSAGKDKAWEVQVSIRDRRCGLELRENPAAEVRENPSQ